MSETYLFCIASGLSLLLLSPMVFSDQQSVDSKVVLTLEQAEQIALQDEPGLMSQRWQARSLSERSVADGQLMDPKLQMGLSNIPTDTFNFNQENMTQFKISIIQQFPAGNTLDLRQQKTRKKSELIESKIAERKLAIIKDVRVTYLEIYYWEQAKETIEKNKALFTQLVDIVQSLFSVGRNDQQDLIRAQLELSRLDERINKITQKINVQRSKLSRWIGSEHSFEPIMTDLPLLQVPKIENNFQLLSKRFMAHPKIQGIDKELEISRKEIDLVKQSYKPGWALNVNYGYRDNNPNGMQRADFVSTGVTMDLPLFTANRQDKKLLSREYAYQALKDKRIELLRQLISDLRQEMSNEEQLIKRHQLYVKILLPMASQQAQASLLAYQSDQSDFANLMRAYIDELNANLDERRIAVDILQTKARILYLTSG